MAKKPLIRIDDTRFIFQTNFSGDPTRDRYGSTARYANIIIPTEEQANELSEMGINVRQTKPRPDDEDFTPTYFVKAKVNYDSDFPPEIYLISGNNERRLLDEDSVGMLDNIYVVNVCAKLNPYYSARNDSWSLYVSLMYVEQDVEDDPWAKRYVRNRNEEEELPFE